MVKPIMKDIFFLGQKSEEATRTDLQVGKDLEDTLEANREGCVGMAANMIGVKKRIIAFLDESGRAPVYTVMLNPEIIKREGAYDTEEGCLSLQGQRRARRHRTIKVQWQDRQMQTHIRNFTGWTAQIIQHEIDHCSGILI